MSVPHVLYQTWKNSAIPEDLASYRDKWLVFTQGWSHPLLTDQDLRDLVKTHFPRHLQAYDSFTNKIERVDFARYVMMWVGGVYADLDTYPIKSIDKWVNMDKIVLGQEPKEHAENLYGKDMVLCNAFMISPPGQQLWVDLMDYIVENYEPYYDPVSNTGPIAMTKFYESNKEKFKDVVITEPCAFYPMLGEGTISPSCGNLENTYVVHVWKNTWVTDWTKDQRFFNRRYWCYALMIVFALVWGYCFWYKL